MRRLALFALAVTAAACGAPDDRLPDAHDQRVAATEDEPVTVRLDASDPDGDALTWTATRPAHGTLVIEGALATYTPAADYHGTDLVEVTASDGERSARSFVLFEVAAVEDAPRLAPDTFPAAEDQPLVLPVTALFTNDLEPDGEPLRLTAVHAVSGGDVLAIDDVVIYLPPPDFVGMARFTYRATDGHHSAQTSVVLRVGGTNDPPVGTSDLVVTTEDEPVDVTVQTLLRNDVDPDGDTLMLARVLDAHGGEVALEGATVRFSPTPDFLGEAGFSYVVSDGRVERLVPVTVYIYPAADPPTTTPLVVDGTEDEVVVIPVATLRAAAHDRDGDPLSVLAVDLPVHGSVGLIGDEVRFWPEPDATGTAGFRYTITDGAHDATGQVTIILAAVDDPPVAYPQARATSAGVPLTFTLLGHDIDDTDLVFEVVIAPTHGTYHQQASSNVIDYVPEPGWSGADSLTFTVRAGGKTSAPATVSLLVQGTPVCGDGFLDPGEACDDGNLVDGDGCDRVCSVTACGNGVVASPAIATATLRWLGATCNAFDGPITLSADGVELVSVPGGDGDCGCDDPVREVELDPAAVAALSGHAVLELRFAGQDSHLAWAELVLSSAQPTGSRSLALYSAAGRPRGSAWPVELCQTANIDDVTAVTPFVFSEECDDGNLDDGDGCSAACVAE